MAWVAWVVLVRGFVGAVSQTLAEVEGPQSFSAGQKNGRGWNFGVGETYDFMNIFMILWSFIVLSCDSSLFSVFSAHNAFELSTQFIFHYFIEKTLFSKTKRLNHIPLFQWKDIISKNQKIKSISKILLNYLLKSY